MTDEELDQLALECIADPAKPFPEIGDWHTANGVAFYGYETMYNAYKNDYKLFKDVYRSKAKSTGLALCYGGSHRVIENTFGVSESEARSLYASFYKNLSGYKRYCDISEAKARKELHTHTLFGKELPLPQLGDKEGRVVAAGVRNLRNYPIQSLASSMLQLAIDGAIRLTEDCDTDVLVNNNIHKPYYNRVVTATADRAAELTTALASYPAGNILVCLVDDEGNITERWDTPLALNTDDIEKLRLKVDF